MDVSPTRIALVQLVDYVEATFRPLTAEKGLDFSVEAGAEAPGELLTDRQRLRQVLGNLLANAVKFTERGHVLLRVARAGRRTPDGGEMLAFSVADTGIGIAPENLTTIFGAFQQGDGTLSRRYGGTGLGLSIAREVGALLGGEITAESELGQGSTFTLYLPCELPGVAADAGDLSVGASNGVSAALNGDAQAEATKALQLQPALPDDMAPDGRRLLVLEGARGKRRAEVAPALEDYAHRLHEIVRHRPLQHIRRGPRAKRLEHVGLILVHRQDHGPGLGTSLRGLPGDLQAIEPGHRDVHDEHVG